MVWRIFYQQRQLPISRTLPLGMVLQCLAFSALAASGPAQPIAVSPTHRLWDSETSFLFTRPGFKWARDPFIKRPGYTASETTEPAWVLTAVIFDGAESEAIINGNRLRIGDEISGRILEEIGPNYVLLSRNDSLIELTLPGGDSPQPSTIEIEEEK